MVSLNNEGVEMILTGRYEEAVKSFLSAIRVLSSGDPRVQSSSFPFLGDDDTAAVYCMSDHEHVLSFPIHYGDDITAMDPVLVREDADSVSVFQLPMYVVDENQHWAECDSPLCSECTQANRGCTRRRGGIVSQQCLLSRHRRKITKTRIDFVLFYNLALSYHLAGLMAAAEQLSVPSLQSAVNFYKQAYWVLLNQHADVPVARVMVILNNVGQIHQHLRDELNAQLCFEELLSTMVVIHRNGDSSRIEHWECFLSNLWCGLATPKTSSARTAPAA